MHYFLLGTHIERPEDASEDILALKDKLQLAKIRLPNTDLKLSEIDRFAKDKGEIDQKNLSRLEIVKEFDHEDEVIKARHMPHKNDKGLVASMTNSGVINLYNIPEIS